MPILGNGKLTFKDGTTLSTASIPYTNVVDRKTNLAQYINDLGNYGNFLTNTSVNTATITTGAWASMALTLTNCVNNTTLGLSTNNCNCNCVCNC